MATKRFQLILFTAAIAMILHTVEEYFTKLYKVDPFIVFSASYFNLNQIAIYLAIQILVLLLIFTLLAQSLGQKCNKFLAITLGLVFLLELLHPYDSIIAQGYYPGLYSGMVLVIIGIFYWKELFKNFKNN